jgi:hypothetical protein
MKLELSGVSFETVSFTRLYYPSIQQNKGKSEANLKTYEGVELKLYHS